VVSRMNHEKNNKEAGPMEMDDWNPPPERGGVLAQLIFCTYFFLKC